MNNLYRAAQREGLSYSPAEDLRDIPHPYVAAPTPGVGHVPMDQVEFHWRPTGDWKENEF